MIISELHGRLGNAMFAMAPALHVAKKLKVPFAVCTGEVYGNKEYYQTNIFGQEFFKNIPVIDRIPAGFHTNHDIANGKRVIKNLSQLPYVDNTAFRGWYFDKHLINIPLMWNTYKPSPELIEEIRDLYDPTRNSLTISVRRGDFIKHQWEGYPIETSDTYVRAYEKLGMNYDKVFVISDDIPWCESNLNFTDNVVFLNKPARNKIFFDLFFPTLCGDNIISCSTFSWWGAVLNQYEKKRVVAPYPWRTDGGPEKSDLIYDSWIKNPREQKI